MKPNISLVVIKPLGYRLGTHHLLKGMFANKQKIPKDMIIKNRYLNRLIKGTTIVKIKLYKGHLPEDFYIVNYNHVKKENPKKYQDIVRSINKGNKVLYILRNKNMENKLFYEELKKIKGKNTLVSYKKQQIFGKKPNRNLSKVQIIRRGYGIRGLWHEKAVEADKNTLKRAKDKTDNGIIQQKIDQVLSKNQSVYYRRLIPKEIDNLIYEEFTYKENSELISDTIHIPSSQTESLKSAKILRLI